MKKAVAVVAILIALIAVGLGVMIATFDADRYRPLVIRELERATGRSVRLERIWLGWRGALALEANGLAIHDEPPATALGTRPAGEPRLQVESARAFVRLLPLLRKEVQISSIVLSRPQIHIARDVQGRIDWLGLAAAAGPVAASRPETAQESGVAFDIAALRVEDGLLHWTDAQASPPVERWVKRLDVTLTNIAPGRPMDIELSAAVAGETPNLRLTGRVTPPGPSTGGSLDGVRLDLRDVALTDLLPAAVPGEPQLMGRLTLTAEGSASTLDPAQVLRAMSGTGRVQLAEPKIVNLNLVREVFARLSMLPGVVQALEERLPPDYQARLAARDTVLSPIDLSARLEQGWLQFDDLDVRTDTFGLAGSGAVGVDGTVSVRSTLRIEPAFSAAIIRSVQELRTLANASGELEIPLTIEGRAPRVAVSPDLNYVASKVLATTVGDLLGRLIEKQRGDSPETPDQASPSGADFFGELIQRALERHAPADSSSQPAGP